MTVAGENLENKPGGWSAFPYKEDDGAGGYTDHFGMTLRDYFAAAALTGHLAYSPEGTVATNLKPEVAAADAYKFADAMIAARDK